MSAPFRDVETGPGRVAAICQVHVRCSEVLVTQETLEEMLLCAEPQRHASHSLLCWSAALTSPPRDPLPAGANAPPQQTFPGKPLYRAAILLSSGKERVGLAREDASQCPDGGSQGRKDKGLSPALAGERDAGIRATQREWGHLTRPQLPSTQCLHGPHSPAPPGLPQTPTTQCFLSMGVGDGRLLWPLRAWILQILAQNPREET